MLRDRCDGLKMRWPYPGAEPSARRLTFARMLRHEDPRPRYAALLDEGDGTHCQVRAARPSPIDAFANLHCAPRQSILISPSDHLNNQKLSIRMWRAFLAALWLMP